MIQHITQDRVPDCNGEQIIDILIPQSQEKLGDELALQIQEKIHEVIQLIRRGPGAVLYRGANCGRASSADSVTISPRVHRQVPAVQVVQKTVGDPQIQFIDKAVDIPVVQQRQVPTVQTVQNTVKIPQGQFLDKVVDMPVVVERQVSTVADAPTTMNEMTMHMNEKGCLSQVDIDRIVQETERCQDKDEANKAEIDAKNGLKNHCVAVGNAATEGNLTFKVEVGNEEKT